MGWKTLDQMELAGKKVLTKVDLNVPIIGNKISDNTRIKKIIPTLTHIIKNGGLPILVSHLDARMVSETQTIVLQKYLPI